MLINSFEESVIIDRLEGWELVEFLQIPVESVLSAAREYDWINEDNVEDLLEFAGVKSV